MTDSIGCMPNGLLYDNGLRGCSSSRTLLITLGIFNILSATLTLIFGHFAVRRALPKCLRTKEWGPWTAIFFTALHPLSMIISTLTIRVNGFRPSIFMTFAMWTMRPRMFGSFLWWLVACGVQRKMSNAYLWTFKDDVVEDALLSVFSLPFAVFFLVAHHYVGAGSCGGDPSFKRYWLALYLIAAAGVISALLVAYMLTHLGIRCFRRDKQSQHNNATVSGFWKRILLLSGANMLLAFSGQWLLWGTFIQDAGLHWCPGSVVGESIAWALALLLISLGRPVVGGPANG